MLHQLVERVGRRFAERYGRPPRWVAAAPGRVNLIGEHTDYNGGHVLPLAIDRCTLVATDRPAGGELVRLYSTAVDESAAFPACPEPTRGEPAWSNYVRGVVAGFLRRGVAVGPFDAVIDSAVPLGGGLSSSAALEVAVATALEAMTGAILDPVEKALLCQ